MIKKLKSYCDKKKLKKMKLYIFPLAVSTVLFTGCSLKDYSSEEIVKTHSIEYEMDSKDDSKLIFDLFIEEKSQNDLKNDVEIDKKIEYDVKTNENYEKIEYDYNLPMVEIDYNQLDKLDSYITLSDIETQEFINNLDETVEYKYSDYFEIENALQKYDQFVEVDTFSNKIISNNKVDVEKFYKVVLLNNKEYINDKNCSSIYKEFSTSELKEICNIITNVLNTKISESNFDINELDEVLTNIKILSYNKYEYGMISPDNVLALNKDFISSIKTENAFEKIVTHETIHLIQKSSKTEQELEGYSKNFGINYKWDDLNVNSLYNEWLIEGPTEKVSASLTGEEMVYPTYIAYINSLEIVTAFDNVNVSELALSKDLDKFYETFSCEGLISREEIATMLYAIDFVNTSKLVSSLENDFLRYYKEKTGIEMSFDDVETLKKNYNAAIYETLSKKMYYELTQNLSNKNIDVKKAFNLMVLFENSCLNNVLYTKESLIPYNEKFIKTYSESQSQFFEIMSNKINMSKEELQQLYNYYYKNNDIIFNGTIKDDMLNDIHNKINYKYITVNEMNQIIINSQEKCK
ncbi:MAG: hypothetical protein E7170_04850 [Firmicutes bacterium]|nr:hypothetical protein [Bacillota bacterium]